MDLERFKCTQQIFITQISLSLPSSSKYRPQSTEPQTDGLSVSTTADGSQPNVRKLCDTPPPAPQAHTQNLAYYDNIICQVRPNPPHVYSPFSSPSDRLLRLTLSVSSSASKISFLFVCCNLHRSSSLFMMSAPMFFLRVHLGLSVFLIHSPHC